MAGRRRAQAGRPLLRQGGGRNLAPIFEWCQEELGLEPGPFKTALSEKLGTTRDRIRRVADGNLGLSPDALWRVGVALHELGVWWMSGPLALALEPRYDAHLLGVVGELVLDPSHFIWRGTLQDFLWHRGEFRESSDYGHRCIKAYGTLNPVIQDLFASAWRRWYAFDASEQAQKEHESNFAEKAPAIAKAVSLLRAQQRDQDFDPYNPSYRIPLRDIDKDIREYFEIGGYENKPLYARPKYFVETSPRFDILSDVGMSAYGRTLSALITPNGRRPSARDAYSNGWDVRAQASSGLLALAVLDFEREFYLLFARIGKPLFQILANDAKRSREDIDELLKWKTWWRSLWAIACLIGPLGVPLANIHEEIVERLHLPYLAKVSDLHKVLLDDSSVGSEFRQMLELPLDIANELSACSVRDKYDPSDYPGSTIPGQLNSVLLMLHSSTSGYPPDDVRSELFWWFGDVAAILDSVN